MAQSCFLNSVENNEHTGRFDKLCSLAAAFLFGLCLSLSHVVHILKCVFCPCGGHRLVKGSRLLAAPCGSCPDITVMVDRHSSHISRSALLVPTSIPCFSTTEPWKFFKFLAYVSFLLLTRISFGVITIMSLCVCVVCVHAVAVQEACGGIFAGCGRHGACLWGAGTQQRPRTVRAGAGAERPVPDEPCAEDWGPARWALAASFSS